MTYLQKMKGTTQSPPRVNAMEVVWSWIHYPLLPGSDLLMLIGSFGASAVLLYGAVEIPPGPAQEPHGRARAFRGDREAPQR